MANRARSTSASERLVPRRRLAPWAGEHWPGDEQIESDSGRPTVLFLCSHNSARSQMAEALLKREAGGLLEVFSAGLEPREVHPLAVRVMGEVGVDIGCQRSKSVREFLGWRRVHIAIFVCRVAEPMCPTVWPGAVTSLLWPFKDPAACEGSEEERLAAFRAVRDQIYRNVRNWLKEFKSRIGPIVPGSFGDD